MGSLRNQVLGLVVGLVVLTSVTTLSLFWFDTSEFTRTTVAREFTSATGSFQQLLASRERQLVNSAELLTADFGFKQAVATRDGPTIQSALLNHGSRVDANLMFVTDLRGQLIASTHNDLPPGSPLPFPEVLAAAAAEGNSISLVDFGNVLYQLVVLPIRAPRPIAFAAVGFQFDETVAMELRRLTGLEVTITTGSNPTRIISTLEQDDLQQALSAPKQVDPMFGLPFVDISQFVSLRQPLTDEQAGAGTLILSARISDQFNAFIKLRDEVFLACLVVLLAAIIGASLFANNITRPLNRLVTTSMRMARGNYDVEPVDTGRSREVGALFQAFSVMGHDIREREELIRWQAEHDELTGLLTRQKTVERMASEILDSDQAAVVIAFAIDGLRDISDALGPDVADEFLRIFGDRLKRSPSAIIGSRLATNEFAQVVMLRRHEESPESVCQYALESLQRPIQIQDMALRRTIRAGYAVAPDDGESPEVLLKRASIAVERARQEQVLIRSYQEGEEEEQVRRLRIINELKAALIADDGQLFMVYQPKLNLRTGRVDKLEALIRWIHPELGFISPELFIALAEQSSLILELTQWVTETVIRQRAAWQSSYPDLQIAINVSAQDLEQESLVDSVMTRLNEHALEPSSLCFEMTERDVMNNADRTAKTMRELRALGFEISVDDSGIGQSSLSKLKQLPVDEIKIDKLFIMTLEESEGDRAIAESTIELGHKFGLTVIAEGVESAGAIEILAEYGCDYVQGYHLSKPLPPDELNTWLQEYKDARRVASQ